MGLHVGMNSKGKELYETHGVPYPKQPVLAIYKVTMHLTGTVKLRIFQEEVGGLKNHNSELPLSYQVHKTKSIFSTVGMGLF